MPLVIPADDKTVRVPTAVRQRFLEKLAAACRLAHPHYFRSLDGPPVPVAEAVARVLLAAEAQVCRSMHAGKTPGDERAVYKLACQSALATLKHSGDMMALLADGALSKRPAQAVPSQPGP